MHFIARLHGDAMHAGEKAGSTVHMHVILRVLCVTYSVRSGREIMRRLFVEML